LSLYLDASVIVPLFVPDPFTARADALIRRLLPVGLLSDLAAAEFASAIARRVRTGERSAAEARAVFADFDAWALRTLRVEVTAADIAMAAALLRGLVLPLRTMDAVHIAAARRLGTTLATFDMKMAQGASAVGVAVLSE
jgi:uncharacterized protein